jgi:hypothetical protein
LGGGGGGWEGEGRCREQPVAPGKRHGPIISLGVCVCPPGGVLRWWPLHGEGGWRGRVLGAQSMRV